MAQSTVRVFENEAAVAAAAAAAFWDIVAGAPGARIAICLSGGSTPLRFYERLLADGARERLPWNRVHWFWGDERVVPIGDERSNAGAACRALLAQAPAPAANVHPIPTDAQDLEQNAQQYARELQAFYGASTLDPARPLFDFMLLGLGADGHTASLFPGSSALEEDARWVVAIEQAGLAPFVPRVTLTLPVLASARESLFLVSGADKRDALDRVRAGAALPAAQVRTLGRLRWFVDRAAAPANGRP